jgi:hypothetical protein
MIPLKEPVKCPDCARKYDTPTARFDVDDKRRAYFMCICGKRQLVGELRPPPGGPVNSARELPLTHTCP